MLQGRHWWWMAVFPPEPVQIEIEPQKRNGFSVPFWGSIGIWDRFLSGKLIFEKLQKTGNCFAVTGCAMKIDTESRGVIKS